jgi:cysteinyl-tRNA synthetase
MALHLHNTLTKRIERFEPAHPKLVRIYSCGLTTYAPMHIGHARTYCFWDLFRRYLEYGGRHVISVINYTDIDDRIIDRAKGSEGPVDLSERTIATFRRDCRRLHIKDYSAYTRATDFIDEQLAMIKVLHEKGHAYAVDGEVLYQVQTFADYGKLSGNTLEAQQVGASGRVEEDASRKRHPADFSLWKPAKDGEPRWPTAHPGWGDGRPGWHIECSAMSTAVFGPHFDVHGGGVDNLFPHHENEIAQSEPVCGKPWVRYWLHPEHLDLKDVKMSKSLGNVIGIDELLSRYPHDVVRWFYAQQHYRAKLPFSWDLLEQAGQGYGRIRTLVAVLADKLRGAGDIELSPGEYASQRAEGEQVPRLRHHYLHGAFSQHTRSFLKRFIDAMDDDLNTPQAVAAMFDYASALYGAQIEQSSDSSSLLAVYRTLVRHLAVLGIEIAEPALYPQLIGDYAYAEEKAGGGRGGDSVLDRMLEMRTAARAAKDFAKADAIRNLLSEAGVLLDDTATGPRWRLDT